MRMRGVVVVGKKERLVVREAKENMNKRGGQY